MTSSRGLASEPPSLAGDAGRPGPAPHAPEQAARRSGALGRGVGFVLLYGLAQLLSQELVIPELGVSVWFAPAAVVLVYLVLERPAVGAPMVVLTRIGWALLLSRATPSLLTIVNAMLVTALYLAAARSLRRILGRGAVPSVPGVPDLLAFLGVGLVAGPLLAAASTRGLAIATGRLDPAAYVTAVGAFWVGDAVAIATFVPAAWALASLRRDPLDRRARQELVAGALVAGAVGWVVAGMDIADTVPLYLALVPIVVLAVRHAGVGAALATTGAALGVTLALALSSNDTVDLRAAHVFLVVATTVGLLVGVIEGVRREASRRLSASEQRYRQMVHAVEDYAIYLLDVDGRIATWNEGAERVKGYTAAEVIGQHFRALFVDEDREAGLPEELIERATRDGAARHEGWRRRADGSRFWAEGTLTRLDGPDGEPTGFTKVTRDLTERRKAEQQLRRRTVELERSNEELDRFASVASHDLQEPLRMVASYTTLLDRRYRDTLDQDGRDFIAYAVDGAHRMQQLINDLLEYSRIHTRAEAHVGVDLSEVVRDVLADLKLAIDDSGAEVTIDPLPTVRGEPAQLRMLFQNLISNAVKYHRAEGTPHVRIRCDDSHRLHVTIDVADDGIGIAAPDRELVFEPFRRLHGRGEIPGTGIGLAICRRIVERHGGSIAVLDQPGPGTTVRVQLRRDGRSRRDPSDLQRSEA